MKNSYDVTCPCCGALPNRPCFKATLLDPPDKEKKLCEGIHQARYWTANTGNAQIPGFNVIPADEKVHWEQITKKFLAEWDNRCHQEVREEDAQC